MHHVSVAVTDLERAKHFYGEVLGLCERPRPDLGFPGAWYDVGTTQELHVIVHPTARTIRGTSAIDGREGHVAFRVASYDDMLARLRAHRVPLIESRQNATPWAQIYVTDPDGNVIEFTVEHAR